MSSPIQIRETRSRPEGNNYRHGLRKVSEYNVWAAIKQRCFNPKCKSYPIYGGRGITMCDDWRNSMQQFYEDMGPRPYGTTIDRIDVNGNYEPGNCRWATPKAQARNIRVQKNNLTGVKGVGFNKASGKYWARIMTDGKSKLIGYFSQLEDARQARLKAETELWQ
jgi:hypothetical protein